MAYLLAGAFAPYLKAHRGFFCMNTRPHRGAFAAFPKQNDKCPGVGWAHLELTDPLCLNKTLFNP